MLKFYVRVIKGDKVLLSNPLDKEKPYELLVRDTNVDTLSTELDKVFKKMNLPIKTQIVNNGKD